MKYLILVDKFYDLYYSKNNGFVNRKNADRFTFEEAFKISEKLLIGEIITDCEWNC